MKKTYIAPKATIVEVETESLLTVASPGGIATGCSLGDEYNSEDVSYGSGSRSSLWGED